MKVWTLGLARTFWFTAEQCSATFRMAGSISTTSTRSTSGTAPIHPAVLPVPKPMTSAFFGCGWRSIPTSPLITWVEASPMLLPSDLPFT